MIESIYGRRGAKQVTCDSCGDGFEADSFEEAVEQMRADDWQKKKIDGKWRHFCPDCRITGSEATTAGSIRQSAEG